MSIKLFSEENRLQWDCYVRSCNVATSYHRIGWKNVIESSFGHKTYYLISEDSENDIDGILPLVHVKSLLFGNFMISLPYFNYGGLCAENPEVRNMLLGEAIKKAASLNAEFIELRNTNSLNNGLTMRTHKVSMLLELPNSPEYLWRSFTSKLKSQIRRPEKEGMYARIGKKEELDSFYKVFAINMRDLGTPVYSKKFFENILKEFPESTWLCTVYNKEDKPLASGFLIGFKEGIEIPWASSIRKYNQYSPNMLLYWCALKFACENGFNIFDFGRCTPGEGTFRFKEQWGARPVQLRWHYWMRNGGPLPDINPENPRYNIAINIWKRLPVGLTRLLGPGIVKNIP